MSQEPDGEPPTDRESPVGEPVIRRDPKVAGERAVRFDPSDPESVAERGVGLTRACGTAACAALVRGTGSYKTAAERAGGEATVSFIRKWARVHDLPRSIRRHVALGEIAPTAAKHIARVSGESRFLLAWAALDHGLTVREIRSIASSVNEGVSVEDALAAEGIDLGQLSVSLPPATYRELRRHAALEETDPDEIVSRALAEYL